MSDQDMFIGPCNHPFHYLHPFGIAVLDFLTTFSCPLSIAPSGGRLLIPCSHRPREFSADLLNIGFLENFGIDYDIITDHDLHISGYKAVKNYDVLITGCHPEYPSLESLNTYTAFVKHGGNIMYLGGNGFYVSDFCQWPLSARDFQ